MQLAEALTATEEVRGWLTAAEQSLLHGLARSVPAGGTIVELGSWMGRSTIMLAAGSLSGPRAAVHAVDYFATIGETADQYAPHVGREGVDYFDDFGRNVRAAGVESVVEPHRGATVEQAHAWAGPPIDLLFIDANHSFEGVRDDFLAWVPHCRAGARVAFHDYLSATPVNYGVRQFVDGLLAAGLLGDVHIVGSILHGTLETTDAGEILARASRRGAGVLRLAFRPAAEREPRHKFAVYHGWISFNRGERAMARRKGLEAVRWKPWDPEAWRLLARSLLKKAGPAR